MFWPDPVLCGTVAVGDGIPPYGARATRPPFSRSVSLNIRARRRATTRDPALSAGSREPLAAPYAPISAAPYGAYPGVPENGRFSKGIALMTTTLTKQPQARPKQAEPPSSPPIPVSGLLDIADGTGFVRRDGYQRGPGDVYVPAALIKQHGLRKGDHLKGTAQRPRQGKTRDKYPGLTQVTAVNGAGPQQATARPDFAALTPLYPQERHRLESPGGSPTARIIDLVTPIGKGQRGLIVSLPKAGKTMVLQAVAAAVAANHPEVHLMVVLVGERPEEVTDLRRTVRGEVIYS